MHGSRSQWHEIWSFLSGQGHWISTTSMPECTDPVRHRCVRLGKQLGRLTAAQAQDPDRVWISRPMKKPAMEGKVPAAKADGPSDSSTPGNLTVEAGN